jgi:hypothetical protein
MPHFCVTSRYWASTWSQNVTGGKYGPLNGGRLLLGEVDSPLLIWFGTTMKYRPGSQAKPGSIVHSFASCQALNHVGCRITLDLSALSVP